MKQANIKQYGLKTVLGKLGIIDYPVTVKAIIQVLKGSRQPTKAWAAWALGHLGTDEVVGQLERVIDISNNDVASWAVWALGEIGSQGAIAVLLTALTHREPEVRWRAATALGKNQVLAAMPALIEAFKNDADGYVRGRVAAALGKIGDRSAVSILVEAISDEDSYASGQIAEALGKIGGEAAVKGLLLALKIPNSEIRSQAVFGLRELGPRGILGIIAALEDEDAIVRGRAADALGELRYPGAIAPLVKRLQKDREYYVRWKVADALGFIGTADAVGALEIALNDIQSSVRLIAVESLRRISSQGALAVLEKALASEHLEVRAKAEEALKGTVKSNLTNQAITPKANLHPQFWITSFSEAAEYIVNKGDSLKYLISIGSPGMPLPEGFETVPHRLRLEFSDIDTPSNDPDLVMPSAEDVVKIIEFASLVASKDGDVLVHCHAGVSRSTAAALTVWAVLLGTGAGDSSEDLELQAMSNVLAVRRLARPNRWLVELADEILERKGKLVEAMEVMLINN